MNSEHGDGEASANGHDHASHDVTISGGPGKPALHFTPEQWTQFRGSDRGAGRSVVLLMASIFTIGLGLYIVVACVCWFKLM